MHRCKEKDEFRTPHQYHTLRAALPYMHPYPLESKVVELPIAGGRWLDSTAASPVAHKSADRTVAGRQAQGRKAGAHMVAAKGKARRGRVQARKRAGTWAPDQELAERRDQVLWSAHVLPLVCSKHHLLDRRQHRSQSVCAFACQPCHY